MDSRLKQDALIEDALNSESLAPMPKSITANVMARIQKDARPQLLTWNDVVLGAVIALSIGSVFFAAQNIPPLWTLKLRIQGILLYQDVLVNARWLVPSFLFGFAALLSALAIPALLNKNRQ